MKEFSGRGLRLGLTTRTVNVEPYGELRNCLAFDWDGFMKEFLPDAEWIMLPSLGEELAAYAARLGVNGVVLTGGNDLGEFAAKDASDFSVLAWALEKRLPLLGVCRGLQVMQSYFGGELSRLQGHAGTTHPVSLELSLGSFKADVFSYHNFGIAAGALAPKLRPFAFAEDGSVEGAACGRAVGVMWHPERKRPFRDYDKQLVKSIFSGDGTL
jgi:putative glutamine amidotransferase